MERSLLCSPKEKGSLGMNIYVGNLSFQMTESDLGTEFEKFGQVERAVIINDKLTQKSKGFGFVEMPSVAEAEAAIKKLDGISLKARTVGTGVKFLLYFPQ